MMKLLPAFLNLIVLAIILVYLTFELTYAPPKYFSPITIKALAVLAIPFALTLIGLCKRGSRTLRIIGSH